MSLRFSLIISLALLVAACGRKAPPKPPEFAAPHAIGDLRADNQADGILLSWGRPRTHADGTPLDSLGGFVVERAPARGSEPFRPLTTIELSDRERFRQTQRFRYLDRQAEVGAGYLYRVLAYTADGYRSEPSNAAELQRELPPPSPPPTHGREK